MAQTMMVVSRMMMICVRDLAFHRKRSSLDATARLIRSTYPKHMRLSWRSLSGVHLLLRNNKDKAAMVTPPPTAATKVRLPPIFFLLLHTNVIPGTEGLTNVIYLPPTVDLLEKRNFIEACDAMLHARSDGETFGLAIAEFSTHNKPVITSSVHHERHTARFHLDVLGDKGLYYHDTHSLVELLLGFDREVARARGDWNAYKAFEPERVMAVFKKVFLDEPRSEPDGDWLNEHSPGHSNAGSSLRVVGSAGASWTSRAQRVASGWPDVGPPDNIFALRAPRQLHSFEAAIAVSPRQHGEQTPGSTAGRTRRVG